MTIPVLLVGGLAGPLIGALALAIRRSTRRQECARLRDELVDAARTGEIDAADWRVFSLIDWFDQVATTGRTDIPGRHAPARRAGDDTLAGSLAATLVPRGAPAPMDSFWPAGAESDAGAQLRATAVRYRERHQQRLRIRPRRPPRPRSRVAVTGRPKPADALVPLVDAVAGPPEWIDVSDLEGGRAPSREPSEAAVPPSLVEEIFAVAAPVR